MASIRSFFSSLFRNANDPDLRLGVFGKHPGWDDHMDDFGIDSEELLAAKQLLYNQGIGGAIDSGLWDVPEHADLLAPFGHWLFWRSADTSILGRLWASSDRKGRSRYPMVVCLQFNRPLSPEFLRIFGPKLEDFQKGCRETDDASRVVQMAESLRKAAREDFEVECKRPSPQPAASNGSHPLCSAQEWLRLVFAFDSQLARFARRSNKDLATLSSRLLGIAAECEPMRLPVKPLAALDALPYWNRFAEHWVVAEAICLFLLPDNAPWVDLLVGRPASTHFFCLKAPLSLLPLTSDIPFELPADFAESAGISLGKIFGSAPGAAPSLKSVSDPAPAPAAPAEPGLVSDLPSEPVTELVSTVEAAVVPVPTLEAVPSIKNPGENEEGKEGFQTSGDASGSTSAEHA